MKIMFTTKSQRTQRHRSLIFPIILIAGSSFVVPEAVASPLQEPTGLNTKETLLATIPDDVEYKPSGVIGHVFQTDAVFRPDGRQVAYPASRGGKAFVMFGNANGPNVAKVLAPIYSSDSRSWAYWASTGKDMYIQSEAVQYGLGAGYEYLSEPVYSPDGKRIAYTAGSRRKRVVIAGTQTLGEAFESVASNPIFSPDGSRIAYIAEIIPRGDVFAKEIVVVGTDPLQGQGQGFERVKNVTFSPTGDRIAFIVEQALPLCQEYLFVDGKASPIFREIRDLIFSPDGKQIAYAACIDGRWTIVRNGTKSGDFERVWSLAFSPDGRELAHWTRMGFDGEMFVVKGSWRSAGYRDAVWGPVYSPDGRRVAFAAGARRSPNWKEFVVVGNQKSEEYDEVWLPRFSPDGRQVVFGARIRRELWWKVLDVRD